jgi:RimJ/RimL family protein N-acetyltransferase
MTSAVFRLPDPPLSDGVVTLRAWRDEDAAAVAAACSEEQIASWLDMVPQPYTVQDARAYIAAARAAWTDGTGAMFAVADARSDAVLGSIGVRLAVPEDQTAEVGYWMSAEARGRGATTRALVLVSRWALNDGWVQRLQLRADVQNVASQRVAEKAGFVREGVLRSAHFSPRQNRRLDWVMYSLLPADL